ncbi:gas vesicle protein GvpO [Streptomyces montanisoli]|uniref:Gas vesicle protein n=1 Tax=Streptomyces montanisoli TaxID=2798581 RepID=A0A940MJB2_9ACTN|nr:gas vesicle protein [Streptomyces montanisoli]MBP0461863.1 gas vesicle protein [Streptomyces montanisoli]
MTKSESGSSAPESRSGRKHIGAPDAMRRAAEQLASLLGSEPESVSAIKKTDDGWTAAVEVMEIERIPDTSSVMASYRVDMDGEGELIGYERIQRYPRGRVDR